jgi:hypothetical protein
VSQSPEGAHSKPSVLKNHTQVERFGCLGQVCGPASCTATHDGQSSALGKTRV